MMDDKSLYDKSYFDGYYIGDCKREKAYHDEHDRIMAQYLKNHTGIGGIILDIGCGIGGFLNIFDDRWEKLGVEPSEYAAEKAMKKGIKIIRGVETLPAESADLVILRGSLQHISMPMQTLGHAVRALKRGGLLVILATPDTDSLVYKIWGRLPPLDAPRNWVLFGHRMLANILKRLGLTAEFLYPYWETPYARPLSDLLKFCLSLIFGYRPFAFPGNLMEVYAVKP